MLQHLNAHLAGTLQGLVPDEWLSRHNKTRCRVCGLCVATSRQVHPTCRPADRTQAAAQNHNSQSATAAGPGGTQADELPTLAEVHALKARTLKHVPKASRGLWAQALTRCLAAVVAYNSLAAWTELTMLPKAVLGPPPRGGRRHARASATFTSDRLTRWLNGERLELWEETVWAAGKAPPPKPPDEAATLRRAEALAREGFDRKACAALLSDGLCPTSATTARQLRALHPLASAPNCGPLSALPMAAYFSEEDVKRCLQSFPRDTAAGPSALRAQHLQDALSPAHSSAFLEQLTSVVQLLSRGEAPDLVAPHLAGASLAAVPKPKGGIRPIAVGEILRRLRGKCLCAAVKEQAEKFFAPAQVGVACSLGVDSAVHTARAWTTRSSSDQSKGLIKLDFSNAFNCIDREKVLQRTRAHFPKLARWAQWCYGRHSNLVFGSYNLNSECGVQQGDPSDPYSSPLPRKSWPCG